MTEEPTETVKVLFDELSERKEDMMAMLDEAFTEDGWERVDGEEALQMRDPREDEIYLISLGMHVDPIENITEPLRGFEEHNLSKGDKRIRKQQRGW